MPRILTFLINYVVSFLNSISNRKANLIIKQRMRAAPIDYSSKVVVYTAIFGGKDRLKEVPKFPGVDYICFTDDQKLTSKTWKVIKVKGQFDEPRRCAKIYKILPHRFLQEYDFSLWVDGTQTPVIDVRFLIAKFLAKDDIAFFAHPLRGCIYEEMQACIRYNKDDAKVIRKQEEKYRTANYPQNHGLIEGTVILRRHNSPKVKEAMEQWWQELNEFGLRDQLSFNYIAYRNNLNYCTIPGHAYDNHFFKFEEHLNPDTSVLNVGWILNGTKETASSRIMGLNVHEYLISKNISSRIMYAPEQRIVSQLPLRLEEIDDIFNTNLNILVLVKLGRGGNLSYLLKKCRFKNIKVVYLVCDEPSKKMIKDSYAIIATSSYFRKVIPKKYHNKLYIAFDGYEDDGVRHKIHSAERKIKLCFVSNQVWDKFPCISKLPEDVGLKIIGPNKGILESSFRNCEVFKKSKFDFEYVEWDLNTVYEQILTCDVGIIPWPKIGRQEKLKSINRLVMFMALGMPVIVSPIPSYLEIIKHGENGFIANTPDEWLEYITFLKSYPEKRREMGERARGSVSSYSKENQGVLYLEILKKILTERS